MATKTRRRWWCKPAVHRHSWRRRHHRHSHHWWRHTHLRHLRHNRLLRGESWRRRRLSKNASELTLVRPLESRHWRPRSKCNGSGWGSSSYGESIVLTCLRCKETFCRCSVSFAFSILLERVLDCDGFVHQKLSVHRLHSSVR